MKFLKRFFNLTNKNKTYKLPENWTETNISTDTFVTNIPKNQIEKWALDRLRRDNVDQMIRTNGFYNKPSGRTGTIYYVEDGKLCEIGLEISGVSQYDMIIFFDLLSEWIFPVKKLMTSKEKLNIETKLKIWLVKENINASW